MSAIDQKEYLKRYLSKKGSKEKRKKSKSKDKKLTKKKHSIKIIDDNIDVVENEIIITDIQNDTEDAPQVVAVIDERPIELRMDKFKDRSAWTTIEIKQESNTSEDKEPAPVSSVMVKKEPEDIDSQMEVDEASPPRQSTKGQSMDHDYSPPRKVKKEISNDDYSPPRKSKGNISPARHSKKHNIDTDSSPPRKQRSRHRESRFSDLSPSISTKTATRNQMSLAKDDTSGRKKDNPLPENEEAIHNADTSDLYKNAKTIVRDRKTGQIRNLENESSSKSEKSDQLQKQYDRWGKGLKQVEDYNEKLKQDAHEMSKPLARYVDDADLETYLKSQEREGDPMLGYIRQKRKTTAQKNGVPLKPEYQGEFMPNRYGIRPGHKWDGVDRSNGYEKKWFEAINKRNAQRDEAYKWNSEDM